MKIRMTRLAALAAAAALCAAPAALAAEPDRTPSKPAAEGDKRPGEQQNRMKTCNAEAGKKNLKGEERKAFMSACLKGNG